METDSPMEHESAETIQERLRAEAAALRRNRRAFRRVITVYVAAGLLFIAFRVGQGLLRLGAQAQYGPRRSSGGEVRIEPAILPPMTEEQRLNWLATSGRTTRAEDAAPSGLARGIDWPRARSEFPWGTAVMLVLLGGGVVRATRAATMRQKSAARALVRFDMPAAAGPLAEALQIDDADLRHAAERALIRLLPRLRATDAPLLDDEQHACLNRALAGRNAALSHAILKAWEQVGDDRDVPAVQSLAEGGGPSRNDDALRSAAWACLPSLHANADRRRTESTLLRACSAATGDDALLRPAEHSQSTDQTTLVRPI